MYLTGRPTMRHAVLSEQWLPKIGGSIQLFDQLYGRSFPPGDAVSFIAGGAPGDARLDLEYPRPVARFDDRRYEWMRPESAVMYSRMLATTLAVCHRERVQMLHCGRVIPEGIVGMAVRRALGTPYAVWVHGEDVSIFLRYPVKKRLMPLILGGAVAVFANSNFTLGRAILAGAPPEKSHVVNPAVDASAFEGPFATDDLRARWGTAGCKVLLTVGRLTRRKGHDVVLRALARLREEGKAKDVVWLVLSDGECETELKSESKRLGVDDLVRWVGPVSARDVARYYALADVFVHPNRTLSDDDVEGFGMVFLEASASGLPVIGGRSGGVVDAVSEGESGLLVDGTSVGDVALAIERLLTDDALRLRMGAAGREWAKSFSWAAQAQRVRALVAA